MTLVLVQKERGQDNAGSDHSNLFGDPIVLRLKGAAHVDRDPDWVFDELHDPETLLNCVPGGSLTKLIGPRRFEARIAVGIGPFKFAYSGTGRIIDSDPKSRTASMALYGRPASNLPQIRIRMAMTVLGHPRSSEIQMAFRVVISDPIRLMSRAWVDPIARDLLDRTIRRVKQRLEDTDFPSAPTAA
jgi:carbon monoxide dehydrogenase subunit G